MLGATAIAAVVVTPDAVAAPTRSIYRYYYAGPAMQQLRGHGWILKCSGGGGSITGQVTNHYRDVYADCPGGSLLPTYEECVVDGFPSPCPW